MNYNGFATNIKGCINELGYKVIDEEYYKNIEEWFQWYRSYVGKFHKYKIYNGYKQVDVERYTLSMPKRGSEDWASLLFNDNVGIAVDEDNQNLLDELFDNNRFDHKFSDLIEMTFALGTGATVVYKSENKTKINYINALMIFPLEVSNGEIVSCAFASVENNKFYINIHKYENGQYRIINKMFSKIGIKYQEEKMDLIDEITSPVKMFQIYKPNITNNIDIFSSYGLSCYANAISQNKSCDISYDSFKNEFELGKKRVFVSTDLMMNKSVFGEDGEIIEIPIFDRDQTEFYSLPGDAERGELIKEVNMELRITDHIEGIQTNLNLFSDACGLGPDRFSFKDGKVYTNETQVISTNSKLYKNLKKHEKLLKYSIFELVRALLFAETNTQYEGDISINFDDSIIEDTAEIKRQALIEYNSGLIDDIQYYRAVYKMTEKQAKAFRKELQKRSPHEDEPPIEE